MFNASASCSARQLRVNSAMDVHYIKRRRGQGTAGNTRAPRVVRRVRGGGGGGKGKRPNPTNTTSDQVALASLSAFLFRTSIHFLIFFLRQLLIGARHPPAVPCFSTVSVQPLLGLLVRPRFDTPRHTHAKPLFSLHRTKLQERHDDYCAYHIITKVGVIYINE